MSDDWFSLTELHERLGALRWVEQQLADVVGDWARIEAMPQAAVYFATIAGHHRWHADVVGDCLATSPQLNEVDVVVSPTAGWTYAVQVLADLSEPNSTSARLRGLVKVIDPWLEREVESLLDLIEPVSDAGAARWLGFVDLDHTQARRQAVELLAATAHQTVRFDEHRLIADLNLT